MIVCYTLEICVKVFSIFWESQTFCFCLLTSQLRSVTLNKQLAE